MQCHFSLTAQLVTIPLPYKISQFTPQHLRWWSWKSCDVDDGNDGNDYNYLNDGDDGCYDDSNDNDRMI